MLVPPEKSAAVSGIYFTVSDLKSVIRTKAALCAAADALISAVGMPREKVDKVYIAGGFGNFLDLRSALAIGLFPPFPLEKFVLLGNASLAGAIAALKNRKRWDEAERICSTTDYHDLSADNNFMELYQRALFIPHTDVEMYQANRPPKESA